MSFQKVNLVQYKENIEAVNEAKVDYVKNLGKIDFGNLIDDIIAIPQKVWDEENQNNPNYNKTGKALHETRHIVFKFSYKFKDKPFEYFDLPIWDKWKDKILPIMDQATKKYGYKNAFYTRAMLALLPPGAFIKPHSDGHEFGSRPHKIHIPITTNKQTFFVHPPEKKYHFEVGNAYEVNNCKVHGVINRGETDRIHLIFEYMPLGDAVQPL